MIKYCSYSIALAILPSLVQAAQPARPFETSLPIEPTRTIEFTTTEGTTMSLDVSPDGKTILFDLLGDLYMLPIARGKAVRLTAGLAWDETPRFSPDGRQI